METTYWVIVDEVCVDDESSRHVVGVYKTRDDAVDAFRRHVETKLMPIVAENGYQIFYNEEDYFEAEVDGFYNNDHVCANFEKVIMMEE